MGKHFATLRSFSAARSFLRGAVSDHVTELTASFEPPTNEIVFDWVPVGTAPTPVEFFVSRTVFPYGVIYQGTVALNAGTLNTEVPWDEEWETLEVVVAPVGAEFPFWTPMTLIIERSGGDQLIVRPPTSEEVARLSVHGSPGIGLIALLACLLVLGIGCANRALKIGLTWQQGPQFGLVVEVVGYSNAPPAVPTN